MRASNVLEDEGTTQHIYLDTINFALMFDDVALKNTDTCSYSIVTRMVKCVEEIEANDKDCDMMQLIGGDMGSIKPRCAKNITLIYPNMYLINRKGYCIIAIKFISQDNQMMEKKTNISFNTYYKGQRKSCFANEKHHRVATCESVDQDPLHNCEPVDCHMKYVGTRSYYNKRWKRCQKVPKCVFDPDKELPDVGYTPITNKCLDLERCIRRSELTPLENKFSEMSESNKYSMILTTINCHHGRPNNSTGLCDCDPGWGSAPFEPIPSLFTFHMCNVEKNSWYDSNRSMVTFIAFFISISSVSVAMLVVLVSFVLFTVYKCIKSMDGGDKKDDDVENQQQKRKPSGSVSGSQRGRQSDTGDDDRSEKSRRSGVSDTNKTVYLTTDLTGRLRDTMTDTLCSELSRASRTSKETFKLSKSSDSTESKTSNRSRTSRESKSPSTGLSTTDKSSKDSLKLRSSLSSVTRKM